jgi:hypothetical protein
VKGNKTLKLVGTTTNRLIDRDTLKLFCLP